MLVTVEDTSGNEGVDGVADPEDADAITFQIDNALGAAVTDPVEGADVSIGQFVFVSLDWSTVEEAEYAGDTHDAVDLNTAVLDSGDAGERDVRALASVRSGNEWSLGIDNVDLGAHTLTYKATDDAGNVVDATLNFTVTEPDPFVLDLTTGMNLISLPGDPDDSSVDGVFGDIPQVNLVFTRDGDRWLVAERGADQTFSGNLTTVDSKHGYWVRATAAAELIVQVPPLAALQVPPQIPVVGGEWNLVPVISLLP